MSLQKKELIGKLEETWSLYQKTMAIKAEMDRFMPEDHYERKVTVPQFPGDFQTERERQVWVDRLDHTDAGAPKVAELAHRDFYGPKEPEKPKKQAFEKLEGGELHEKQVKFGRLSKVSAGFAIFFLLGTLLNLNDEYSVLPTLIIITLIAAAGFLFFRYKAKAAKTEEEKENAEALLIHNRQQEAIMAEYAEKRKIYEKECEQYELTLQEFMKDYLDWRDIYLQSVKEETQIEEQLEADRMAGVEKLREEQYIPAEAALNAHNDLVPEDYLPVLNVLIDLLKSNRADDLKEAINLYEDIVYRERQLQLQREQEEQRRYEEELRRQDEERHHKEQMQFQQEQERQRKYEAQQQLRMQEQQHKDEMKMQEARLKQEAAAAKASQQKRCVWCAHKLTCRQQYYDGAYNCTGFTPK